jgi:hypothetical protein
MKNLTMQNLIKNRQNAGRTATNEKNNQIKNKNIKTVWKANGLTQHINDVDVF